MVLMEKKILKKKIKSKNKKGYFDCFRRKSSLETHHSNAMHFKCGLQAPESIFSLGTDQVSGLTAQLRG